MNEIRELLDGYSVVPARQTPLRRDFGKHGIVEGLDVQAHPQSGTGDVWIRGLLRGDDMYFLVAWKTAGGLLRRSRSTPCSSTPSGPGWNDGAAATCAGANCSCANRWHREHSVTRLSARFDPPCPRGIT